MPAYVTHSLFGQDVADKLSGDLKILIGSHRAAFEWGLQGPDLLFFRNAVKGGDILNVYGSLMHVEKTDELFTAMTDYVIALRDQTGAQDDYARCLAYLAGFYCHYTLDKNAHPYVYHHEERMVRQRPILARDTAHARFESDIDSVLYQERTHRPIRQFPLPRTLIRDEGMMRSIGQMYRTVLRQVYQIDAPVAELMRCFTDTYRAIWVLVRHGKVAAPLARMLDRLTGRTEHFSAHVRNTVVEQDVLNHARRTWDWASDPEKTSRATFEQVFEDSVVEATANIEALYDAIETGRSIEFVGMSSFGNGDPCEEEQRAKIQKKLESARAHMEQMEVGT